MTCSIGDWIAFYRDAMIVIGEVRYIGSMTALGQRELLTDSGMVREDRVLECRRAAPTRVVAANEDDHGD